MLSFDGMTAIVTGAGRGIGEAHARLLAKRGAAVVVNDLDANPVADEVVEAGGRAVAVVGSVTDPDVREQMVDAAVGTFGGLDVVVNNAGMGRPHPAGELRAEHLRLEFEVHVVGALMLTSVAWPHLAAGGRGSVVFTSSGVGLFGKEFAVGYGAAKAALVGAVKVLALEGVESGIRVNAVAPMAETRMAGGVFGALTDRLARDYVAAAVAWLAHPACALTGTVISAAGGRIAEVRVTVGRGGLAATPEDVAELWPALVDDEQLTPLDALDEVELVRELIERRADPAAGER